jgi:hypothetical protein
MYEGFQLPVDIVCGINPMGQFGANLRQMNERLESLGPMSAEERQNQIFSMLQQPQSVTFESLNQGQVPIGIVQSFERPINPFLQFQQPMPQMGFQPQGMRLPSSFEAVWNTQAVQQTPQPDFNRYWNQPIQQPDFNRYWNQPIQQPDFNRYWNQPIQQLDFNRYWNQQPDFNRNIPFIQPVQTMNYFRPVQQPSIQIIRPVQIDNEIKESVQVLQDLSQDEKSAIELERLANEYNQEAEDAIQGLSKSIDELNVSINNLQRQPEFVQVQPEIQLNSVETIGSQRAYDMITSRLTNLSFIEGNDLYELAANMSSYANNLDELRQLLGEQEFTDLFNELVVSPYVSGFTYDPALAQTIRQFDNEIVLPTAEQFDQRRIESAQKEAQKRNQNEAERTIVNILTSDKLISEVMGEFAASKGRQAINKYQQKIGKTIETIQEVRDAFEGLSSDVYQWSFDLETYRDPDITYTFFDRLFTELLQDETNLNSEEQSLVSRVKSEVQQRLIEQTDQDRQQAERDREIFNIIKKQLSDRDYLDTIYSDEDWTDGLLDIFKNSSNLTLTSFLRKADYQGYLDFILDKYSSDPQIINRINQIRRNEKI